MVAATADRLGGLAVFELAVDGSGQKGVSLGANSNLAVFVLSEGPHKGFLIDDLLRDNANVIHLFVVFRQVGY